MNRVISPVRPHEAQSLRVEKKSRLRVNLEQPSAFRPGESRGSLKLKILENFSQRSQLPPPLLLLNKLFVTFPILSLLHRSLGQPDFSFFVDGDDFHLNLPTFGKLLFDLSPFRISQLFHGKQASHPGATL